MPHEPKPLPTGNKLEDRQALHKYNKAHIKQFKQDNYNKRNVDRAREIAHEGTYTSKRNLIPGFDGIKVMNSETTEKIPQKVGPYSFAQQEINNLAWVIENKNLSDQERSMLEAAKLQLQNRLELGLTQDQTWNNQIARNNMNAKRFFETGTPDKEPDLSNYENFAEYRRRAGANQDLTAPTTATPPAEEVEPELQPNQYRESTFEKGEETNSKIGKIGDKDWTKDQKYDRTDPTQRRDRRLQDKLVEGRPLDKFKLNVERGNTGTPVSELFHKDKRRR